MEVRYRFRNGDVAADVKRRIRARGLRVDVLDADSADLRVIEEAATPADFSKACEMCEREGGYEV